MQTLKLQNFRTPPFDFTGIGEWPNGTKAWYKNGHLHREDGPAVEWGNGDKAWYKEGRFHREDGPAREFSNGTKHWYLEGERWSEEVWKLKVRELKESKMEVLKLQSLEVPPLGFTGVAEYKSGNKYWYKNGKQHREDGPAIEYSNGYKAWLKDNKLHREDGPAKEWPNGSKEWFKEGKRHREDGPAREWQNGSKEWYLEGQEYSEQEWKEKVEKLKEPKMEVLKLKNGESRPDNFTGIIEFANGTKEWYKEGKYHRLDGPAIEWSDGGKAWYLEDENYRQVNLKDYVILDSYRGRYGIMWYKLLGVDKIIEYPNIPGLIIK